MKVPGMSFNEFPVVKHKPIRAQAFLDLSHAVGNIIVAVKEDFINRFPKNLFKTQYIDTSVIYRQFSKGTGITPDFKEVAYNSKPTLAISPKYDYNYVSEFYSSFFHDNVSPVDLKDDNIFMGCPFADHDRKLSLKNTYTRIQMRFEFTMEFDTEAEMRNTYGYIIRRIPWDRHLPYLECTLENKVPREFIKQIAIDSGFMKAEDKFIKPEMMKPFVDYLNSHSPTKGIRFVQKYQNGTGNKEIFTAYETDLLMYFEGAPNVDEGSLNGQVREGFSINLNLVVQCTVPSVYYYCTEHSHYSFLDQIPVRPDGIGSGAITNSGEIVPHTGGIYVDGGALKIPIAAIKYDYMPESFTVRGKTIMTKYLNCGYEIDEDLKDEKIPIDELFDSRIEVIKKYYEKMGLVKDYYCILVFENTKPLMGCKFDADNYILTVPEMKKECVYMIALYLDMNKITDIENNYLNRDRIKDGYEGKPSKMTGGNEMTKEEKEIKDIPVRI